MKNEREVAGLRCSQVLGSLSEYLDDGLSAEQRNQVEDHLKGCDTCARFGGEMSDLVRQLRTRLLEETPVEVRKRLRGRLAAELDSLE